MPDPTPAEEQNFESAFTDAASASAAAVPASQPVVSAQVPATPPTPTPVTPAPPQPVPTQPVPPSGQPPVPTTQLAPQLSPYAAAAREAGLAYEGLTDEQIAQAMAQHIVKTRPYASYGQQMAPYADRIREYFDKQPQEPQTPAVPAGQQPPAEEAWDEDQYFTAKWDVPEWNDTFTYAIQQGIVVRNPETGLFEAAAGSEALAMPILTGLNEVQVRNNQQWQSITRGNPYRQFYDVLREPLQNAWREDMRTFIAEESQRQAEEQRVNRFEADNANWLYSVDPQSGQQVLTSKGQVFYAEIANLRQRGITDPSTLLELASRLTGSNGAAPTPSQATTATPSAPSGPPVPVPPNNPLAASAAQTQTFLQNALERASHTPSSGGYSQVAPDNPVTVNESELNNMFLQDFRQSRQPG